MARPQRPSYFRSLSSYTQKDKPRLYVTLYPRGGSDSSFTSTGDCDSYHWSFVVGPQTASRRDPGTRYHVTHSSSFRLADARRVSAQRLVYEENDLLSIPSAQTALVRVAVAKVVDMERLVAILRSLPISGDGMGDTCLSWVREAFAALHEEHGCLKSYLDETDWKQVEKCARDYCRKKREQRRWTNADGPWDMENTSTFNFWENRETVP